jgi:hypothetical protein
MSGRLDDFRDFAGACLLAAVFGFIYVLDRLAGGKQ